MADHITWEMEGKRAVIRQFAAFKQSTTKRLRKIVRDTVKRIEPDARNRCPRATRVYEYEGEKIQPGHLAESITSFRRGNVGFVGTPVGYARYVEFGTISKKGVTRGRQKAQPFLYPAARLHTARYQSDIRRAYEAEIGKANKQLG